MGQEPSAYSVHFVSAAKAAEMSDRDPQEFPSDDAVRFLKQ